MDQRVTEFAVAEAKARFSELLGRAERGEEITVKRHGKTVARIMPPKPELSLEERMAGHERWAAWRRSGKAPTLGPNLTIRQLIDEGRKY